MRKILFNVLTLISILFYFHVSAQNIPRLGNIADSLWSKQTEINIGKSIYNNLLKKRKTYQNQIDNDYLNHLGYRISNNTITRLGFNFYITKSASINAFATPGGYIGINTGLILETENEHELAGVLAHEIAHISQEHIAQSIVSAKNRQLTNAMALTASILVASKVDGNNLGPGLISAVVAGEKQSQINNIRNHEIDADRVGRELMEKAGFSELGMQSFFAKLKSPINNNSIPTYLLTHPLPIYRQSAIDNPKSQYTDKRLKK